MQLPILFNRYFEKKNLFFLLVAVLLFLISAFRNYNVGTDTMRYINYFIDPINNPKQEKELGYDILVAGLRLIFDNPRILLIVISTLIIFPIYKSIKLFSEIAILSIIIFALMFFPYSLNIMRQFIVIAIFYYWGIKYILEKNFLKFLIVIILCSLFHKTAIILFLLYFFIDIKYSKLTYLIIWLVIIPFYFMGDGSLFVSVLNKIHVLILQFIPDLQNYLKAAQNLIVERSFTRGLIFNSLFFLFLVFHKKFEDRKSAVFFNLFFISVIFLNLFFNFRVITRIVYYFQISFIYLAAILINRLENKVLSQILYIFYILIALAIFINSFYLGGQAGVFQR